MTSVIITTNTIESEEINHEVGNYYIENTTGALHILACTGEARVSLIDLSSGYCYDSLGSVSNIYNITKTEVSKLTDGRFTFLESVNITANSTTNTAV